MQRPLDVHLVRELRVALSARGQERREVEDDLDLVVRGDLVEEVPVHDVAGVRLDAERAEALGERREIDGDGGVAPGGVDTLEERATDLAVGAGDEDDGLGHVRA